MIYIAMMLCSLLFAQYAWVKYGRALMANRRMFVFFDTGFALHKTWLITILITLPFILVAGLRWNVGTDYLVYLRPDHYIGGIFNGLDVDVESGFRFFINIGMLYDSKQLVFFLNAVVFAAFMFAFIFDQSLDWRISIILLLITGTFSQSLNIMRQMSACAICLYATKYIYKRQLLWYGAFVLLAFSFHKLAILYVPFYFADRIPIPSWKFVLPAFAVLFAAGGIIRQIVNTIFVRLNLGWSKYFFSTIDTGTSRVLLFVCFCIMGFCLISMQKQASTAQSPQMRVLMWLQLAGLFMLCIQLPNANRLVYSFLPAQVVLIPNLLKTYKKYGWLFLLGIFALYTLFYIYYYYYLGVCETFPYQSIFQAV